MNIFKAQEAIKRWPLADIKFMQDKVQLTLKIADDITSKEAAQLSIMFAVAVGSSQSMALWDYVGYIKANGLERHFVWENQA